jgi:hypothetical protein
MAILAFADDDPGYRGWVRDHQAGFVLNATQTQGAGRLELHRTTCHTVSDIPAPESRWTSQPTKLCSDSCGELIRWARETTGGAPCLCRFCTPS